MLKFYNVYKRIKEVGELTLGDLTVIPSPHPPVANSLYLFSSKRVRNHVVSYTAIFWVVTQRSSPLTLWGGALPDDTKNGCVAD